MVHRIVVHQRGDVDQLDHRREGDNARIARPRGLVRQEQQGGPEHLSLHLEKMRVHLGDQAKVRLDDAAELLLHLVQPLPERLLQFGVKEKVVTDIDAEVRKMVDDATEACKAAPMPPMDILTTDVYADGGFAWRN